MELIAKIDAKLQGLPRYFTGKPCNRGHVSERYINGHCIECSRFTENARYELLKKTEPDKLKERNKLENIKSKEYRRAYDKRSREENPDKFKNKDHNYYINNSEKKKENVKNWVCKNMSHVLAYNSERRAKILKRSPRWLTDLDREKIKNLYVLAKKIGTDTGVPHEVDHIIPLKGVLVSGLHVPYNLQIITFVENRKKYNHFNIGGVPWQQSVARLRV